jgi:hypothetical protein
LAGCAFVGGIARAGTLAPATSFARDDHLVATSVFHWFTASGGQQTGPWRPIDGRANWTGTSTWWKTQIKQMMSANIDVLYVHLIPSMDQQRVNLFQALSDLRQQGYRTPKVAPFLDPIITWDILGPINVATTAGKDNFVGQYQRFFEEYFATNTDAYADDYLAQIDNRVVLDTWHTGDDVLNPKSLTRADVQSRLAAEFGAAHPVFNNGIHMVTTAGSDLTFADEQVYQFQVHEYFIKKTYGGVSSAQLKGGYWDQNIRDPGYRLPRDGGTHYDDAWARTLADPSISRVYIESWNEYDEGSGIYAANPGLAYIHPGSAAERLGSTDTWSATNDPYQYIRATADGARQFNEIPDRDAAIVAEDMPLELMPGETRTVTLVLRNEGDLSWTGAAGYGFAQHTELGQTPFVAGGAVAIDDARYEIPTYGGVFRGRPITMQFQVTAPEAGGTYATSWQMRQHIVPPEYRNDRVLNWHGNTEGNPAGEQAPGLVTAVDTSPGLSGDSPMDAFGAVGGIEPETFIFRDNGTVDNGNQTLGDGGETVDYLHFTTGAPVTLEGYSLWLPTDEGQQNAYRSTALVQLTIDDVVVDFFDNDGRNGTQVRSFVDGPVTGQDFRIDLTRVTTGGPRIGEIDAILAKGFEPSTIEWFGATLHASIYVVPEPAARVLVTALVFLIALRRRRVAGP